MESLAIEDQEKVRKHNADLADKLTLARGDAAPEVEDDRDGAEASQLVVEPGCQLQRSLQDSGLLSDDVLRDVQAALAIQRIHRGAKSRQQTKEDLARLTEMKHLRDDAKRRQCAMDAAARTHLLKEAAQEQRGMSVKQLQHEVAIQHAARAREAANIVHTKERKQQDEANSVHDDEELDPHDVLAAGDDEDDEALSTAAVSIQRHARGRKARKEFAEHKEKQQAAVKLQSITKGRAQRKAIKKKKEEDKRQKAAETIQKQFHRRTNGENDISQRYPFFASDRAADISLPMLQIKKLQKSSDLKTLDLSHACIGGQGAVWLSAALRETASMSSLVELNLQGNYICDTGAKMIAVGLMKQKVLQKLNLSWNGIGDDGSMLICHALCKSRSLQELNLSYNRIANLGGQALALSIDCNPILLHLNLEGNSLSWHAAKWVATACSKGPTQLQLNLRDMFKATKGKPYDDMVDRFFESDLPVFLKETFWPTFRERWGILACQPLPKTRKDFQQSKELSENQKMMEPKIDSGLTESAKNKKKRSKASKGQTHLPGLVPGKSRSSTGTTDFSESRPGTKETKAARSRAGTEATDSSESRAGTKDPTSIKDSGNDGRDSTTSMSAPLPNIVKPDESPMSKTASCPMLRPATPSTAASSTDSPLWGTRPSSAADGTLRRSMKQTFTKC